MKDDIDAAMKQIVDNIYESGLSTEQQCNVAALLTFVATHFVPRIIPLTSTERSRIWREKRVKQRGTSPVPDEHNIYNNIYNNKLQIGDDATSPRPTMREAGCNPRAIGTNPRALGINPKALGKPTGDEKFDEFWKAYPRKIAKGPALKAWRTAVKNGAKPDEIINGARKYASDVVGTSPIYIKYPQGWISGERWKDELDLKSTTKSNGSWKEFTKKEPEIELTSEEKQRRLEALSHVQQAIKRV